jgi:hypothetical protein
VVACEPTLVPRFDTDLACVAQDETRLFDEAHDSSRVLSHVLIGLTSEATAFAEELVILLSSLSWEKRDIFKKIQGLEELQLRRRLHELLVQLRGNDIWVYATQHIKRLPESHTPREDDEFNMEMQLIIAFGPPGEHGEDTIKVPVDHGQPWIYDPTKLPF